ncbi:hypothetical protein FBU30_004614 [Linnemannia zychae]|nr:hypothetical protein FBU30_004614 [Linnemannia zychae]
MAWKPNQTFLKCGNNGRPLKGALSRATSSGDSTDEDGGHGYHDNEMMRTEGRNRNKRKRKYAKITSTRRAVLTMGLTLISVVAVMGIVGCQASKLLRRR